MRPESYREQLTEDVISEIYSNKESKMNSKIYQEHWVDANGNPAGGNTFGNGFAIGWQNGPLGRGEERKPQNGAFVEDVISAAIGRIEFYQSSKFKCYENEEARKYLCAALACLQSRTMKREERHVEGTHSV